VSAASPDLLGRMSRIGIGTARGDEDEQTDERLVEILLAALRAGVRVIDTAVNYRSGRSERAVGEAVRRAVAGGVVARHEVVVITKVGYTRPSGGIEPIAGPEPHGPHDHCLAPDCVRHQVRISREALGIGLIDVCLLHNPEEQWRSDTGQYDEVLARAFDALHREVDDGVIGAPGVATWRTHPGPAGPSLDVGRLSSLAGGSLAVVEAPLSLLRPDVLTPDQLVGGSACSVPVACARLGTAFVASAAAGGGAAGTLAAASVAWAASVPGVTTALVGTLDPAHLAAVTGSPSPVATGP
jgi:aryl-alcohol dehydrogenase-like predicted oxidoreductase